MEISNIYNSENKINFECEQIDTIYKSVFEQKQYLRPYSDITNENFEILKDERKFFYIKKEIAL